MIAPHDILWLAGLLEGEGSFCSRNGYAPLVKLEMQDVDIVKRAASIAGELSGHGKAYTVTPYDYREQNKEKRIRWYFASSHAPGMRLALTLYPYMGDRRQAQIDSMYANWKGGDDG